MIKHNLNYLFYSLLSVFVFFTLCNGQDQTQQQKILNGSRTISIGHPKLIKSQGSNEYQNICCGLQDKAGNLWFGTSGEGVYRYDGKSFTQLTMLNGLISNSVHSILEDKNGNIWFGTRDGLCLYNGKNITAFSIVKNFSIANKINNDYYTEQSTRETVWSMLQDKSGRIWFGTGDGVYWYDGKNFSHFLDHSHVVNQAGLMLKMVSSILEDKNGNIWFGSGMPPGQEGICYYDGQNLVNFKPKNEGWFRKIIEDKNGNLIFATRMHGVLSCDLPTGKFSNLSFVNFPQPRELLNNSLTTILKSSGGDILIASDYGKNVGDTLGGIWCYKQSAEAGDTTFKKITNKAVSFLLEDKDNNIWLGTRGMGLYRYNGKTFTSFTE